MKIQNPHIITETLKERQLLPWVTEYCVKSAKFKTYVAKQTLSASHNFGQYVIVQHLENKAKCT